jgi:carboxypeptidase Q
MLSRRQWLAAASAATVWPLQARAQANFSAADLAHAERLRELALADGEAWRLVESLTRDVGARPAGSEGDRRANAWALAAFERLKLEAARTEAMNVRVWQRGAAQARLTAPYVQPLVMTALGNSVAAPAGGIEAELAYYPDLKTLAADTSDRARGRIVFIDERTERTRDGSGYGRAVSTRVTGASEAAKRGALALAIRSVGTSSNRIAHTGAMRYDIALPRLPAFAVSTPDADLIAGLQTQAQAQAQAQAQSKLLRLHFTLDAREGVEVVTHNLIAEIKGSELPDEVVLIGAHIDSWDLGQGALDDGAGVAIVMAAAALIQRAGLRPKRTIRVVLFGNEENGFDGAHAYSERYAKVKHQLVGESDFGAARIWRFNHRVSNPALPLMASMAALLAPLGVAWAETGRNEGNPGPDAAVLMRRHRWPAVALTQDGSSYFDVHHTENDTLDKVERAALPFNVACWAVVAWLAAQAPMSF